MSWLLILGSGLLGSAHCVGMCGPIAASLGASGAPRRLQGQLLYSVGRVLTYSILGAIAFLGGARLSHSVERWIHLSGWLAVLAGLFLVYEALSQLGVSFPWKSRSGSMTPCSSAMLLSPFFRGRGMSGAFLAGALTAFLPCGLLYGMLALAGSRDSLLESVAVMSLFGAGTIPAMLLAGLGFNLVASRIRGRVFQVAAWLLLITGAMSTYRGAAAIWASSTSSAPSKACPFCSSK